MLDKDHEHVAHPNFARGQETEEHGSDEERRPDFARGQRTEGEVTTESERGDFAEGTSTHREKDVPQGDFARGIDHETDREAENLPDR